MKVTARWRLACSPDGAILASVDGEKTLSADKPGKTIKLWDVPTSK